MLRWLAVFLSIQMMAQEVPVLSVEVVGNYRDSKPVQVPVAFRLSALPEFDFFQETVDPGFHWELSRISLMLHTPLGQKWFLHGKLDLIDLYDRNPTSTDRNYDLDAFWLRWGQESQEDQLPEAGGATYLKMGKFGKFERQDDRHLPSYGLLSTAFNRMEDAGFEMGHDIGAALYLRASFTVGNPLFIRDANALAGDNGTTGPDGQVTLTPKLKNGVVIFYDADLERYDFQKPQLGWGLGWKKGNDRYLLNILAWGRTRKLRESVDMGGSEYGGDLDLLLGLHDEFPEILAPFPALHGDRKSELGSNIWLYGGDFNGFGQYIHQDIAGLKFKAWEVELAYWLELPALSGAHFAQAIEPVIRYSELNPQFKGLSAVLPSPSLWWEWKKTDYGVNFHLSPSLNATLEYSNTRFLRGAVWWNLDEWLASFTYKWRREF